MERISIVGCSGSGKTTLARRLSRALGATHVELDAIYHQRNWTPLPRDEMRARVAAVLDEAPRWVADGNYSDNVRDLVWAHADAVIWLDLPRLQVTARVLRRTILRGLLRKTLWNGNRERLRSLLNREADDNIVLWAWKKHPEYRADYAAAMRDPDPSNPTLRFVRLRSQRAVDRFVRGLSA